MLLGAIEVGSFFYLKSNGEKPQLFYASSNPEDRIREAFMRKGNKLGAEFWAVDPLLGHAYDGTEEYVKTLTRDAYFSKGFVTYAKKGEKLERPVIVTLGGSTTDGILFGHSWPEELAKVLKSQTLKGTVVNGGTGAYSTNQELLKLIRDGLEFEPDIVISYSGINDRGYYNELPHPMVSKYQKDFFNGFLNRSAGSKPFPIFPSTVQLLNSLFKSKNSENLSLTLGVESTSTVGHYYKKNVEIMHSASTSQGAKYYSFIQPFALYKSKHSAIVPRGYYPEKAIEESDALYEEIQKLPATHDYVFDISSVLEKEEDVYQIDGAHLKQKGDAVIAKVIFGYVENQVRQLQAGGTKP